MTSYVESLAPNAIFIPGAIVPFGMVQLSPDTRLTGWDGCSGYHYSDSIVYGFSHTHLSGTGISDYGDILLMPTVGEVFLNALGDGPVEMRDLAVRRLEPARFVALVICRYGVQSKASIACV